MWHEVPPEVSASQCGICRAA